MLLFSSWFRVNRISHKTGKAAPANASRAAPGAKDGPPPLPWGRLASHLARDSAPKQPFLRTESLPTSGDLREAIGARRGKGRRRPLPVCVFFCSDRARVGKKEFAKLGERAPASFSCSAGVCLLQTVPRTGGHRAFALGEGTSLGLLWMCSLVHGRPLSTRSPPLQALSTRLSGA